MENVTQEQFPALGAVGLGIVAFLAVVCLLISAGTLKLCIARFGNGSLTYAACVRLLLTIMFLNPFLIFSAQVVLGQLEALIAIPLTWFLTVYMLSSAADCGLLRALGIWIANSILFSAVTVGILLVITIPLVIIGSTVDTDSIVNDIASGEVVAPTTESKAPSEQSKRQMSPEATPVGLPIHGGTKPTKEVDTVRMQPASSEPALETTKSDKTISATDSLQSKAVESPQNRSVDLPKRVSRATPSVKPEKTRRAADGSMLNPFYKD